MKLLEALKMIDIIADEIGVWLFDSLAKEGFYLDDLREHIKNQEKAINEHEALKKDVAIFKDTLNSIKAICNEPSPSWILSLAEISKRYIEIDNLINTYDEKLSKVGKEE